MAKGLREHVFNTMPIRLLCFEPHATGLQIVMLERGAIYTRLAAALHADFQRTDRRLPLYRRGTETKKQAIDRLLTQYYTRYAILSHTWLRTAPGEVTYSDWSKGALDPTNAGYQKLVNFCQTAWTDHEITLGWMDTVCINKDSSAELDESIRSMYNWYARAEVCIIYLAQTGTLSTMSYDPWFTRGWTLQELLAPRFIVFYNRDWIRCVGDSVNDKHDSRITEQIQLAMKISTEELSDIRTAPISRRMQLAAAREVTREEDTAYSLMGIFNISMATAYGKGAESAFFRLLQHILDSSTYSILDIFNWAGALPNPRPHRSQILPTSPQHYRRRSDSTELRLLSPVEPLALTHLGMRISVLLMPATTGGRPYDTVGDYYGVISTLEVDPFSGFRVPTVYNLLNSKIFGRGQLNDSTHSSFAVYNFYGDATDIWIPKTCIAILLECSEEAGKVYGLGNVYPINTEAPIVFELKKTKTEKNTPNAELDDPYYYVNRDEITMHGMQLITLYL